MQNHPLFKSSPRDSIEAIERIHARRNSSLFNRKRLDLFIPIPPAKPSFRELGLWGLILIALGALIWAVTML